MNPVRNNGLIVHISMRVEITNNSQIEMEAMLRPSYF